MFPVNRQVKLNPILEGLRKVPGVEQVWQDDFDSAAILVHMTLSFENKRPKHRLCHTIQRVKAVSDTISISRQPQKRRSYMGKDHTGRSMWFDEGYDGTMLSVEVWV